jgi:hypothetical protein
MVAIFIHFCEMFVGVWPLVRLFWCFIIMKAMSQHLLLIGGYYVQHRTQGLSRYIMPIYLGRWER